MNSIKYFLFLISIAFSLLACQAQAQNYRLSTYEAEDGAIVARYYGLFEQYSAVRTITFIEQHQPDRIEFYSPGGMVNEGLILGHYLSESDIIVDVREGEYCLSTCAFAILPSQHQNIEGIVGFHSPYMNGYFAGETLYDIGQDGVQSSIEISIYFLQYGYSIRLWNIIALRTNHSSYVAFDNEENLAQFRNIGPIEWPENYTHLYTIMTQEDADQYAGRI